MKLKPKGIAMAMVAALILIGCSSDGDASGVDEGTGSEATLTIAAWAGPYARAIREIFVPPFEQATGANVVVLDEGAETVDKILAAPEDNPPFDLVVGDEYIHCYGLSSDTWERMNYGNIPRSKEIRQEFLDLADEDCKDNAYGVPFGAGFDVIIYNSDALGFTPTGWADFWRPEAQGKIGMDAAFWSHSLTPAAKVLGIDPTTLEGGSPELSKVFDKTAELDVALWATVDSQQLNALKAGDVAIAQNYIQNAIPLAAEDDRFDFVVPEEGTTGWIDYWMISRGTQQQDLAEEFVNQLLDPELQSQFAELNSYLMANEDASSPGDELFPKNAVTGGTVQFFNYDVWLPNFFDKNNAYTEFSRDVLG